MSVSYPKRVRFSWLTLIAFGLAVSVFIWGLQYKLSLYYAQNHQIPAKLLSKKERPVLKDSPLLDDSKTLGTDSQFREPCVFPLCVLTSLNFRSTVPLKRNWDSEDLRHLLRFASLSVFFFRPPPALS